MKSLMVGLLCAAAIVLYADAGIAGGKRNGSSCQTHRSCQSKVCARLHPDDKFGTCCVQLDCPAMGAQCGIATDGCGVPIDCGQCGPNLQCIDNLCVNDTTTTSSTTTSTSTTSSTTSSTTLGSTTTTLGGSTTTTTSETTTTTLGNTTTTSSTTTTTFDDVCIQAGSFVLSGPFANVEACVEALILEADTRCCSGQLNPSFGFEFGIDPPLCRGHCYWAP
jgi:hypothetical protein